LSGGVMRIHQLLRLNNMMLCRHKRVDKNLTKKSLLQFELVLGIRQTYVYS
jgi:hypothetical protein